MNDQQQPQATPAPAPPQAPSIPPPQWQASPPVYVSPPPKPVVKVDPATPIQQALAVCSLVLAFLFWRWGVWGGFRLGFSLTYALFFLSVTAFGAARAKGGLRLGWKPLLCGATSLGLAATFALYNDPLLQFIAFAAITLLTAWYLMGLYGCARRPEGSLLSLLDAARVLAVLPFRRMQPHLRALFMGKEGKRSKWGPALVGIVTAIPVMAVAGALLASGDAAFSAAMERLWRTLGESVGQLLLAAVFFFPLFNLLFGLDMGPEPQVDAPQPQQKQTLDSTATSAFLGAVSGLYLIYLFSQLAYFLDAFSGLRPEGYTYAEYARRGFFELCAVAAINLGLLLLTFSLARKKDDGKLPLAVRILSVFICAFTLLLIATAEAKMALYVNYYGMTRMRLMVALFILLLALAFLLLLARLFLRSFGYLTPMLAAACVLLLAMSYADVDRTVLRYNIWAYETGRLQTLDVSAFWELGSAKIPYLIELSKSEDETIRNDALEQLAALAEYPPYYGGETNWSQWNRTQREAARAMGEFTSGRAFKEYMAEREERERQRE